MNITEIIVTFLSSIIGAYLSAHWNAHPPNIKKIASQILKIFLFSLRYIIPTAFLILLYINDPLTKAFVIEVVIICGVIIFNASFDVCMSLIDIYRYRIALAETKIQAIFDAVKPEH